MKIQWNLYETLNYVIFAPLSFNNVKMIVVHTKRSFLHHLFNIGRRFWASPWIRLTIKRLHSNSSYPVVQGTWTVARSQGVY